MKILSESQIQFRAIFTFLHYAAISIHYHQIHGGLRKSCYKGVIRNFEGAAVQDILQHIYKTPETRKVFIYYLTILE